MFISLKNLLLLNSRMSSRRVTKGSGMILGLEVWIQEDRFILVDVSPDGRFAADVEQWKESMIPLSKGLNVSFPKKRKDAKK